jgi:hypothetical protein
VAGLPAYAWIVHHHLKNAHWTDVLLTWPYLLLLAACLLALLGATPRTPRFVRALAIYGIGALAAYSIIHYKTPWCVVSLTWPFLLLFGYGVDFASRKYVPLVARVAIWVIAAALLGRSAFTAVQLNFFRFTDPNEPYVYVQTFEDVNKLMDPLNALVARNPSNYSVTGHIMVDSYHPLPWLLGDFPNIGYYDDDTNPPKMDADFLLVEDSRIDEVESALRESYFTEPLTLRDAQDESRLYLNAKTFRSIFPGRKPDLVPAKQEPAVKRPSPPPVPAAEPSQ